MSGAVEKLLSVLKTGLYWFDTSAVSDISEADRDRIDWLCHFPYLLLHFFCLAVFIVGVSPIAVIVAIALYTIRMFGITAFYHRYFSHRAFRTNRFWQFIFAVVGNSAAQRGPLWWAAHHRLHHRHTDTCDDVHSPIQRGFWWSHVGWFTAQGNFATQMQEVKDFARFPELVFLDRFPGIVPLLLALSLYGMGEVLHFQAPHLGTNGAQMLVWGFFISTVCLHHATFAINSVAHLVGTRPYKTDDHSRNNLLLAIVTLGEGWHNNHHRFPASARQGLRWWELDITYIGLKVMAGLGIVWDLKQAKMSAIEHSDIANSQAESVKSGSSLQ